MYSWNATHPWVLPLLIPQGALQISAAFERSLLPSLLVRVQFSEPHGEPDMPIPKVTLTGTVYPLALCRCEPFSPGATWARCKGQQPSGICSAPCQQSQKRGTRDVCDGYTDDAFPFWWDGLQKYRSSASRHWGSSSQRKHLMIYEGRGRKQTFSVYVHN